jgi:hypothetical protein
MPRNPSTGRKSAPMTKSVIRADDVEGFFARAKDAAQRADRGQAFEGKVTLSFEDPQLTLNSKTRSAILAAVHETASDLHRLGHINDSKMQDFDRACLQGKLLQGAASSPTSEADSRYFAELRQSINRREKKR